MTTQHSGSGDIDRSLELLWEMREAPARGPKPTLSLDQIVEAAVIIADAEGLDAVSMRRVASALGVGTMSLYRHVPGKAELLDLMLDHVNECVDDELLAGMDWRKHLETCARGSWSLYKAHPWLLHVDQSRPLLGPNAMTGLEQYLAGLAETGLSDTEKMTVISTIDAYTSGLARQQVNANAAEERTGMSDDEFWSAQTPVIFKAMSTGNFPTIANLSDDAFSTGYEEIFEFGLQRILDGLERYVESRRASARAHDD